MVPKIVIGMRVDYTPWLCSLPMGSSSSTEEKKRRRKKIGLEGSEAFVPATVAAAALGVKIGTLWEWENGSKAPASQARLEGGEEEGSWESEF